MELQALPSTYTQPQLQALYRRLEERLNRLPGVRGSGLALYNPLTDNWGEAILVQGHPAPTMGDEAGSSWDRVSADYLPNLGVRMVRVRAVRRVALAAERGGSGGLTTMAVAAVARHFSPPRWLGARGTRCATHKIHTY